MSVLVTGGTGMVGKHLQSIMPDAIYLSSKDCDLTKIEMVRDTISLHNPDVVIHLAARVGGIQDNIKYPADYFDENILMNTNIVKVCKEFGVRRFIGVLSTCIYPDKVSLYPMKEEDMFLGPPTPTNFSYGYAKRCLAVQIDAYNKQYGTKYNYLIPCNLYSEFDEFHEESRMHFVAALLKKIKNSDTKLNLLGTGKPLRQFMYAGDLSRIIKYFIENDITCSVNVAPKYNYSINEMAEIAISICGKKLDIVYSNPELDGQFRKDVCSEKLINLIPEFEFTSFSEGLAKTYKLINKC